ncbi:hypothetical protein BC940DRAFT_294710 [Gongronella butleri]|nr:hypothetical protein BC940DRAFT_294710 [Gongronella butleri]
MSSFPERQESPPLTRGEAACRVHGAIVNSENREAFKRELESNGYDVVWSLSGGVHFPIVLGEGAIQRNLSDYRRYDDTPPPVDVGLRASIPNEAGSVASPSVPFASPTTPIASQMSFAGPSSPLSHMSADIPRSPAAYPTTPIASQMPFDGPSSPLASQSSSVPGPSSSVPEPSSSVTGPSTTVAGPSTTGAVQLPTVVATPNSIIALLRVAISVNKPHNEAQYQHLDITPEVIRQILVKYLPSAFPKFAMKRIMQLIGYDPDLPNLNKSDRKRMGWLLNESALNSLVQKLFNLSQYQAKARSEQDWETIGYARKSVTYEENYTKIAQDIVDDLRIKLCCEKVYASMKCAPMWQLWNRDKQPDAYNRKRFANGLCHVEGDMQGFIAYAINAKKNIRLVFPDYDGLSTNGQDVRTFLE